MMSAFSATALPGFRSGRDLLKGGKGLVAGPVQLDDGEEVLGCPVEGESRGVVVAEGQEDDRHEVHDPLLGRVATLGRDGHLPEHGATHEDREEIDWEAEQMGDRVGLGEVVDPEEVAVAQFDRAPEHRVESEKDRDLDEHRETSAEGIDPVLLVELHQLLVHLLRVVLILLAKFRHLRREKLHPLHGGGCLVLQGPEGGLDEDGEDDDGGRVAVQESLEGIHRPEEELRDEVEHAEVHDLLLVLSELAEREEVLGAGVETVVACDGLPGGKGEGSRPETADDPVNGMLGGCIDG